jgi:hypothetical protein
MERSAKPHTLTLRTRARFSRADFGGLTIGSTRLVSYDSP